MNDFFCAKNIVKRYENHTALKQVSISVPEGTIFGLLGPNGAGKTTLLRIINQIIIPDSGELFLNNEKLSSQHIKQIGYLPEERGLYKKMKVGEQVLYLAQLKGLSKSEAIKKIKIWFEKFDLLPWANRKVQDLSKGMQQKVQFIVTILHEPRLLIFDEPFTGFDPINVNLLKEEMLTLRKNGATIILSTHNMSSVEELCDHITLINRSENILSGSVDDIRQKFKPNIYRIVFSEPFNLMQSTLTSHYKIIEHRTEKNKHILTLQLVNQNMTINQLIQLMLDLGEVTSFSEVLPGMNDIFIKVVRDSGNTTN